MLAHEEGFQGLARELDPDDRSGHLLRAQVLDRLMPSAVPMAEFEAWRARFPVDAPPAASVAVAVLIVGDDEDALQATVDSLHGQSHPHWTAVGMAAEEGGFAPDSFAMAASEILAGDADVVVVVEATSTRGAEPDTVTVS